jgi:hypothetical protein
VTLAMPGDALNIRTLHEKCHGALAHLVSLPHCEFRVHPHGSVNTTVVSVHLAIDVSEPRVAHAARRRDPAALRVETAFGNVEYWPASLN